MSAYDTSRPKKPQWLIDERLERLQTFIRLKAPACIIAGAAEQYLKSFKWSWRGWWFDWKMNSRMPHWLLCSIDSEYRRNSNICIDLDEEETAYTLEKEDRP